MVSYRWHVASYIVHDGHGSCKRTFQSKRIYCTTGIMIEQALYRSLTLDRVAARNVKLFSRLLGSPFGQEWGSGVFVGQDPLGFYSGKRRGEITSHLLNFTVCALPVSGLSTPRERWSGCWMLSATSCKFARHLLYSMRYVTRCVRPLL